jgi:hypothetical protein
VALSTCGDIRSTFCGSAPSSGVNVVMDVG